MPTELLVNPESHQWGLRHAAEEGLAVLHFQQADIVNDEL
jgi:hypothetical protein